VSRPRVAIVALVLLAGCGSSGAPRTQAEYARRADSVCTAAKRKLETIPTPAFDPPRATAGQLPQAAAYLAAVRPILSGEVSQLRGLGGPIGATPLARQLLAAELGLAQVDAAAVSAARQGDLNRYKRQIREALVLSTRAGRTAQALGLRVCGNA
jgi:hypothetical protein